MEGEEESKKTTTAIRTQSHYETLTSYTSDQIKKPIGMAFLGDEAEH